MYEIQVTPFDELRKIFSDAENTQLKLDILPETQNRMKAVYTKKSELNLEAGFKISRQLRKFGALES